MKRLIITGVLLAPIMMFTSCGDNVQTAQIHATDATIAAIRTACEVYRVDTGVYPPANLWPGCLFTNPAATGWNGPYIRGELRDAWGHEFQYSVEGTNIAVVSSGPDGQFGTKDDKDGQRKQLRTSGCGATR